MQLRVPELTIYGDLDNVEYVLTKVIPTHSLRINLPCKIDKLWPLISGLNLNFLECYFKTLDKETITLFDSFPIKTKQLRADCDDPEMILKYQHLFRNGGTLTIRISGE